MNLMRKVILVRLNRSVGKDIPIGLEGVLEVILKDGDCVSVFYFLILFESIKIQYGIWNKVYT